MDNKILLDLDLFKLILDQEIRKLTGITMKRFEISDNKEEIKKQVREIQYEWGRNLFDILKTGKILFTFNQSMGKKGD